MKVLVTDCENTGLFRYDRRADQEGQPRLIQLSTSLVEDAVVLASFTLEVKPDGFTMDDALAAQLGHRMTHAWLLENGIPVRKILDRYLLLYEQADVLSGFNVAFDQKQLRAEFRRAGMPDLYGLKPEFDVMRACKPFCGATDKNGRPKNPKLTEAVLAMLGRALPGGHTADVDVAATGDLYYDLKRRGVDVSGTKPESKLHDEDTPEWKAEPKKSKAPVAIDGDFLG